VSDDDRNRCSQCRSPDVVSYWKGEPTSNTERIYRHWYAKAQRCVDCDHVMLHGAYAENEPHPTLHMIPREP
jgi:hypothetical protein